MSLASGRQCSEKAWLRGYVVAWDPCAGKVGEFTRHSTVAKFGPVHIAEVADVYHIISITSCSACTRILVYSVLNFKLLRMFSLGCEMSDCGV